MYTPSKDVLPLGPKPVMVQMILEIPPAPITNVSNAQPSSSRSSTRSHQGIQLNSHQKHEYETKFKQNSLPNLSLSKYIYRQIQPLPDLNLKRTSRCLKFCELIENLEQLITEEEFITMTVESPKKCIQQTSDPIILLSSSSDSEDCIFNDIQIPLINTPKVTNPTHQEIENEFSESILLHALESTPDIGNILSATQFKSPSPMISKKRKIILSEASSSSIAFSMEPHHYHNNTKLQDLLDKRQVKKTRKEPKEINCAQQDQQEQQETIEPAKEKEKIKFKKPKPKVTVSNELFDLEAQLSSNDNASSDTEGSDLDQDLSGFVVGNDQCTQFPGQDNSIGFYRKSLLSPEAGGMGIVQPGAFQFREITHDVDMTPNTPHQDSFDTPGSLASFIVDDEEEILFDLSQESLL